MLGHPPARGWLRSFVGCGKVCRVRGSHVENGWQKKRPGRAKVVPLATPLGCSRVFGRLQTMPSGPFGIGRLVPNCCQSVGIKARGPHRGGVVGRLHIPSAPFIHFPVLPVLSAAVVHCQDASVDKCSGIGGSGSCCVSRCVSVRVVGSLDGRLTASFLRSGRWDH